MSKVRFYRVSSSVCSNKLDNIPPMSDLDISIIRCLYFSSREFGLASQEAFESGLRLSLGEGEEMATAIVDAILSRRIQLTSLSDHSEAAATGPLL